MNAFTSIPLAPGELPVLGHVLPLARDPLAFLRSLPVHGELVRIRLGGHTAVLVCDPGLTRTVLLDDRTFDKGGPLFDRGREVLGDGLATCPHRLHRRQRRLCQPSFHTSRIPGYADLIAASAGTVALSWYPGQVVDVTAETSALALRTTVETMFGSAFPAAAAGPFTEDLATVLNSVFRQMITPPALSGLPIPAQRRYKRALTRLRRTVEEVVASRRADEVDRGDLLSSLMSAQDTDGTPVPGSELADQVFTFFAAGTETTGSVLAWALALLIEHPRIEERLHAEVDAVVGAYPLSGGHLPRLELTGRVITEAMRLCPPTWLLTRTVTSGTELGGFELPAGTTIAFSPYLLHHRADLYEDPERFDPDRWLRPIHDRAAYLPFGAGARQCIGNRFALAATTLGLAAIISRWRLVPLADRPVRPSVKASLRPGRLQVRLLPRHGHGV